ncbi:MAG: hypothetical protein RI996_30 [Candidatus Parcubacteria bacterium]|jgi:uncharacterized protein YdeI (YjbR/CyaY-like superfamily)
MKKTTKTDSKPLHSIPTDIQQLLDSDTSLAALWNTLTPLAHNEWICWVTIVKKEETRKEHLVRLKSDILAGKRRPCCWPGCPHRRPSARKYFEAR